MDLITTLKTQWDRAIAVGATSIGLLALIVGWFGASGTPELGKQIPYFISGGLGAVFLLAVGGMLWLSADLRDQWRELRRIRIQLEQGIGPMTGETVASEVAVNGSFADDPVVVEANGHGANGRRRQLKAGSEQ